MRKLSVAASKNYDILIGNGLLSQLEIGRAHV